MTIFSYLDATILNPSAKMEDYKLLCEDAIRFQFAAVCVPPFMVEICKDWLRETSTHVATVVGFPTGYHTIDIKMAELAEVIHLGADEVDYVVHRGFLSNSNFEKVEEETELWVSICKQKNVTSKWIIEASELTYPQIDRLIDLANQFHPDYVKTSTGVYGKASLEHVSYLRKHLTPSIKIKAAGGISDYETALKYIDAGANRLGISQYRSMVSPTS